MPQRKKIGFIIASNLLNLKIIPTGTNDQFRQTKVQKPKNI
jgi:hypothetical protein